MERTLRFLNAETDSKLEIFKLGIVCTATNRDQPNFSGKARGRKLHLVRSGKFHGKRPMTWCGMVQDELMSATRAENTVYDEPGRQCNNCMQTSKRMTAERPKRIESPVVESKTALTFTVRANQKCELSHLIGIGTGDSAGFREIVAANGLKMEAGRKVGVRPRNGDARAVEIRAYVHAAEKDLEFDVMADAEAKVSLTLGIGRANSNRYGSVETREFVLLAGKGVRITATGLRGVTLKYGPRM